MKASLIFLGLIFFINSTFGANPKGCIAVFHQNKTVILEVELPPFQDNIFQTSQFKFSNLPNNMTPNEKGSYCYPLEDKRFGFVNIYFYTVNQINAYNKIYQQIKLPFPKKLTWSFNIDMTSPSGGHTELSTGGVHAPGNVVDPQMIYHELGHWIAFNAMQANNCPSKKRRNFHLTKVKFSKQSGLNDNDPLQEAEGIDEGSATILGSLYSGITREIPHDGFDLVQDNINNFVRIPDLVPSVRTSLLNVMDSPKFLASYPEYAKAIEEELKSNNPILDYADPYSASAIVNQPLWQAAGLFGSNTIAMIYLKALNQLSYNCEYKYKDLIQAILYSAHTINPETETYLKNQYSLRIDY